MHPDDVPEAVLAAGPRGLLARGLGRSYGDAAQNAGGQVLLPLTEGEVSVEDTADGPVVGAPAGLSFDELIVRLLERRLFVPVTPGTRQVTIGGAVAADVHGKNHHVEGSFGAHVVELELVTADGRRHTLRPTSDPELFWATVGGMGLTGVITRVSFRARPVSTGLVLVTEHRVPDVTRLMAEMSATDHRFTYSVAWIDTLARGRSMGRSVLGRGEHASPDDLGIGRPVDPWPPVRTARLRVPVDGPPWLISRPTVRAFNEVWYRHAPARARRSLVPLASFFHPLDRIAGWNRLYGRLGMVQYQFAVPDEAGWAVVEALRRFSAADQVSALAVLKRFGPGNPSPLSFPMAGWTLAVDLPATPRLVGLLQGLDRLVLEAGGRVYLAKDSRLDRSSFRRMYPRFEAFRRVREHHDPERVFQSDLSRRLDL